VTYRQADRQTDR